MCSANIYLVQSMFDCLSYNCVPSYGTHRQEKKLKSKFLGMQIGLTRLTISIRRFFLLCRAPHRMGSTVERLLVGDAAGDEG